MVAEVLNPPKNCVWPGGAVYTALWPLVQVSGQLQCESEQSAVLGSKAVGRDGVVSVLCAPMRTPLRIRPLPSRRPVPRFPAQPLSRTMGRRHTRCCNRGLDPAGRMTHLPESHPTSMEIGELLLYLARKGVAERCLHWTWERAVVLLGYSHLACCVGLALEMRSKL